MSDDLPLSTWIGLPRTPRELRDEVEALIRDDLVGPLGRRGGGAARGAPRPVPARPARAALRAGRARDAQRRRGGRQADRRRRAARGGPRGGRRRRRLGRRRSLGGPARGRGPAHPLGVRDHLRARRRLPRAGRLGRVGRLRAVHQRGEQEADGRPAKVWRRRPRSGARTVAIGAGGETAAFAPNPEPPEVIVRRLIRGRGAHRLVSLFLVNGQAARRCMPNSSSSTAAGRSSARRTSPRARCPRTSRSGFSYAIPPSPGHSSGMCSG